MDTGQVLTRDSFMLRVPPWLTLVRGLERQKSQGLGSSCLHILCPWGQPNLVKEARVHDSYLKWTTASSIPGSYLFLWKWVLQFKGVFCLTDLFNRSLTLNNLYLKHNVSHHKINKIHKKVPTNHLEQYTMPTVNSSLTHCIIQFLIILSTPVKGGRVPLRDT